MCSRKEKEKNLLSGHIRKSQTLSFPIKFKKKKNHKKQEKLKNAVTVNYSTICASTQRIINCIRFSDI